MAKLTKAARASIPTSQFAGPHRSFPIPDRSHARAALSMAHYAQNPGAIRSAVAAKYPGISQSHPHRNLGKFLHPKKSR